MPARITLHLVSLEHPLQTLSRFNLENLTVTKNQIIYDPNGPEPPTQEGFEGTYIQTWLWPQCIHRAFKVTQTTYLQFESICAKNKPPKPTNLSTCQMCMQSSLTDIEQTLPPYQEGRDRKLTFESDGSITYEQTGDEPPDINGYKRDEKNPWHFLSLWPDCLLRHGSGIRYASCGCINVIMRCNNPETPTFGDRINHTQCQTCQWRKP